MLDKTYDPADIEARIHQAWEAAGAFRCGRVDRKGGKPYCIVIPPPNVTGSLHMGHALNNTLQDVLVRFERMRGADVLWQPGTDHAGIATQMVVERQMMEKQEPDRRKIGREAFLKKVWAWKEESGGTIVNQLKRLGASCDWSRERFTMDEGLSRAVLKVFVELHRAGLIYKDKRLVNWDPQFQTAISDLEVEQRECKGSFKWSRGDRDKAGEPVALDHARLGKLLDREPNGHMYYFNYPLDGAAYDPDDADTFITVATTRPETMLGDTAVAVHPSHEKSKFKHLIGKHVLLPLTGRKIPIIGDEYADPEKGTGAVKITPAHDFNDFEVGKRHAKELVAPINIFDAFAKLNENAPEKYRGLARFDARKKVVADLDALSQVVKIEPTTHTVPHGDRSGVPVEPWLTDQWYVNAAELAKPALASVKSGKTRFVPERFAADYFRWLDNITPWCISRQLWWGHQIPVWYGRRMDKSPNAREYFVSGELEIFCATTEADAIKRASDYSGRPVKVVQQPGFYGTYQTVPFEIVSGAATFEIYEIWRDPDVLDTWFSSALWPFSTLGWPDATPELARYYPTAALVTGFDIIFFWVARMMMMGTHFMGEVPFRDVYIHGLVRDEKGAKMSKSKGNVVDPLVLIDEYGADALRFSMAAMASQGSDIKYSKSRVEGYRNFATKIWNATRFAEMNGCARVAGFDPRSVKHTVNRWIVGETERTAKAVTTAIEEYRFDEAARSVYELIWGRVCDWYVELTKPILAGSDEAAKAETRACTPWVLDQAMSLLHPFMPFITEELWAHAGRDPAEGRSGPPSKRQASESKRELLALSPWPELSGLADAKADAEIGALIDLISEIRSVRTEMNVPAGAKVPMIVTGGDRARHERHRDTITRLARVEPISFDANAPKGAAVIVAGETTVALPLAGIIDMEAESKRLAKTIGGHESDIAKMDAKLNNPNFMAKAAPEAIEEAQARKAELLGLIEKLKGALARIET